MRGFWKAIALAATLLLCDVALAAKPTGTVTLNTSHPLYGRLKFAAPLTETSGAPKDLVSNTTGTLYGSGSGVSYVTDSRGANAISNQADPTAYVQWDSINLTGFNGFSGATGSYTVVVIGAKPHNSGAARGLVMVGTPGGASDEFGFDALSLFKDSNGPAGATSLVTQTVDVIVDVAMSLASASGSGGGAQTGLVFYTNGSSELSNTGVQTDSIATSGSIRILHGRQNPLDGTIEGVLIYSGQLNSSEIASLMADPWAVLNAPTATVVNPSAASMAFSGATSTVTKNTRVLPSAVSMAFTGATSTVSADNNKSVSPTTASLAFSGATSAITNPGYTWYSLPAPGSYDSNSILAGQTYPTGSWLRVVTDWAHITSNYAVGPLQNDINDYSTAEAGYTGSDSATYQIKTPAGATSGYTVTASINGSINLGSTTASLTLSGATPTVTATNNKSASPTAAAIALTGAIPMLSGINQSASPSTASLIMTVATPNVAFTDNKSISPAPVAMAFTGVSPSLNSNISVAPAAVAMGFGGATSTITATGNKSVSPSTAAMAITALTSTVAATANQVLAPAAAAMQFSTAQPFVGNSGAATAVKQRRARFGFGFGF